MMGVKRTEDSSPSVRRSSDCIRWDPLGGARARLPMKGPEKSIARTMSVLAELKVSLGYLARESFTDRTPTSFPRMSVSRNTLWERPS